MPSRGLGGQAGMWHRNPLVPAGRLPSRNAKASRRPAPPGLLKYDTKSSHVVTGTGGLLLSDSTAASHGVVEPTAATHNMPTVAIYEQF